MCTYVPICEGYKLYVTQNQYENLADISEPQVPPSEQKDQ